MIESGKIQPGHIFTVDSLDPTVMVIKEDDLGTFPPHTQNMMKDGAGSTEHGDRATTLARIMEILKALADPGIAEITQVELWKNGVQ